MHPAGTYGSPHNLPATSYASPVASLQTWVNGFNPPHGSTGETVKTESPIGSSPGASIGGAAESGATSSGVSPLSASSSSPYTTAVSATHLNLHPSYAGSISTTSALSQGYDQSLAASYYPGYYHPTASALTTMEHPSSAYYSAQTSSHISPKY